LSLELEFAGGVELEQAGAELGPEHVAHRVDREEPVGLFRTGPPQNRATSRALPGR
jgi:hypothetical protein